MCVGDAGARHDAGKGLAGVGMQQVGLGNGGEIETLAVRRGSFASALRACNHGMTQRAGVELHDHIGLVLQESFRAIDRDLVAIDADLTERRGERVCVQSGLRRSEAR